MNTKIIIKLFKWIVSVALIVLLIYGVDLGEMETVLPSMHPGMIALVFFLMVVQFPVSTVKWGVSLRIHQLHYSFGFLQKVLCIGFFFNNFLPSTIGGDGYRVIKTMPDEGYKSRALSAVLVERIIGFGALLFLGLIGALFTVQQQESDLVVYYILLCSFGFLALAVFLWLSIKGKFDALWQKLKKIKKLDIVIHNLSHINNNWSLVVKITIISLLFQIIAVAVIYFLCLATGIDISFMQAAFLAAIIGIAAVLPISINGIGVVEGSFVAAAVHLGIDYNQAVVVAFALRILVVPLSIICGMVYLFNKEEKPVQNKEATS